MNAVRTRAVLSLCLLLFFCAAPAAAQETLLISGRIVGPQGDPVAGAVVTVSGTAPVRTDADGSFHLRVAPGSNVLRVEHPAYRELERRIDLVDTDATVELRMDWITAVDESVTVVGIRAGEEAPVTMRNMNREEIQTLSFGQDVPELIEYTPSVTWYSDSGAGSNYSYFSIRGIQQSRINMTFDGAPLNDPAEHAVYFNNFHDFANDVDSIQIQRGVGTSSVGSPSFGGSVNFSSPAPRPGASGDARVVIGAFDTTRASAAYGTGVMRNGFHVAGRFSYSTTEGYRDHSGSEHDTFFINAGWQGDRSTLKLTGFTGREASQLAYLAVDPATLAENRRFNPMGEDERDDFSQNFLQLQYTRAITANGLLTASAYYNGASGIFYLWDDPVARTDLLEFGIDQSFWGTRATYGTDWNSGSATFGVHYNDFAGDHTLDTSAGRAYINTGYKQTFNGFAKAEVRTGDWLLFGDLQLRWARFRYAGDIDLGSVDWTFLDPRAGVRFVVSPTLSAYASVGRAQREPARLDMLAGEDNATVEHDLAAVKPEAVINIEAGINLNTSTVALQANLYAMEFRDEIALTGELSPIGLPLRRNVDDSSRRGIEIDLRWVPSAEWIVTHSLNLSRNRIDRWTQFYDVYDASGAWAGSEPITYFGVRPLLTPELIGSLGVEWSPGIFSLGATGRYVAESQLDNTDLEAFTLPSLTNVDLRAAIDLRGFWPGGSPRLTLHVNNLFDDADQYGSGYSYQYLVRDDTGRDTLDGLPYFYPLATRYLMLSLEASF
jgi:iron complex outermembrane receptor protein